MSDASRAALNVLCRAEDESRYLNLSLSSIPKNIRAQVTAMVYTVAEHRITLDYYISALAMRSDVALHTRRVLRLGLARLLFMDRVPGYAVVDDTVGLALNKGEAGFCNAILRRALRESGLPPLPAREKNEVRYLSVRYSVAPNIIRALRGSLGEDTEEFIRAISRRPATALTVNTMKTDRDALCRELKDKCVTAEADDICPMSVITDPSFAVQEQDPDGKWFVQGVASCMAVNILSPKEDDLIVDVCSAPGGKTAAAAVMIKNKGSIYSFDIHESKLSLIRSLCDRLGITCVTAARHDSTEPRSELVGKADCVICDVPCSGLGVLAKKPDLRYRSCDTFSSLPELQYKILCASSSYLKPGCRMVYSTCTVRRQENEDVVARFISENSDFRAVPFLVGDTYADDGMFTFLPHVHGTDGFFTALIERKG